VTGYLEKYLWKFYGSAHCTPEHTLSIMALLNIKCRDSKSFSVFDTIVEGNENKFELLFQRVVELSTDKDITRRTACVAFLINVFQSIGTLAVRRCVLPYVSLPLWKNISEARLNTELSKNSSLQRHWDHQEEAATTPAKKKKSNAKNAAVEATRPLEETWFPLLITHFLDTLMSLRTVEYSTAVPYLELFSELICDLISQLPTRRFLVVLLDDWHYALVCRRSPLYISDKRSVFSRLVDMIDTYLHFSMDNQTGRAFCFSEVEALQARKIHFLQKAAFELFPKVLGDLIYSSTGELSKQDVLRKYLLVLDEPQIIQFSERLGCLTGRDKAMFGERPQSSPQENVYGGQISVLHQFAMDVILNHFCQRASLVQELNGMSLFPSEEVMSDYCHVPHDVLTVVQRAFPFPKLNLQFLTLQDYLLRNYQLYRLEYAAKFRSDLVEIVSRLRPKQGVKGAHFGGWSRMALPLLGFSIDEV
jgi:intron-binding protein aquarius